MEKIWPGGLSSSISMEEYLLDEAWDCGHPMIIDDYGQVIAENGDFNLETPMGAIDINRIRQNRSSAGFNYLA